MPSEAKPTIDWSTGIIDWHLSPKIPGTTILLAGDILLENSHNREIEAIIRNKGSSFLFEPTQTLFHSADLTLGNLENPLSQRGEPIFKWGPNFRGSPEMAGILKQAGFSILELANNHIRDFGDDALLDTIKYLKEAGISTVGLEPDDRSIPKPIIVKRPDLTVGIFAFAYQQESTATEKQSGAANLDNSSCFEAVRECCNKVDKVLVFLHIDPEFSQFPAPYRVKMAHRFIDVGAEMVIGHHPHVPQGFELYKTKLIAYSLGDFIFYTHEHNPLSKIGCLLKANLTRMGTATAQIVPYKINECFQPTLLAGKDWESTMQYLKSISLGLLDPFTVYSNWQDFGSKDALRTIEHILHSIRRQQPYWKWACHLTNLRQRYRTLLSAMLKRKIRRSILESAHVHLPGLSVAGQPTPIRN